MDEDSYDYRNFIEDIHRVLKALKATTTRRVKLVLLIDEIDELESISRLRRELRSRNLRLLLLGDEVEELVQINESSPRFLRRLRRSLQSSENIRTILASKIKLWDLANEETTTSPFLHGFTPPLFVRGLEDDEARSLIRQSQLGNDYRPDVDERATEIIRTHCNNHRIFSSCSVSDTWSSATSTRQSKRSRPTRWSDTSSQSISRC